MSVPPPTPRWVRWALRHLLDEGEQKVVRDELADLHESLSRRMGGREADRRYRRQLRQYPLRLLAHRVDSTVTTAAPGLGRLTQAVRSLLRAPGLTATIILTVGLGIGGSTTIFSMVDALYLRPLPYPDSGRLEWIYTDAAPNRFPFSVVDFRALREQQTSFEAVAALRRTRRTLETSDGVAMVPVMEATPGLMEVWGIVPARGRTPSEGEGAPDASPTAMVTAAFAQRWLGVDEQGLSRALGSSVRLDGEDYQIIGILPSTLGPLANGVGVVPTLRLQPPSRKGPFFLRVFGRLRAGVGPDAARSELRELNDRLFPLWVDSYQDQSASWNLVAVDELARGGTGPVLAMLMGAVGMVLLIALANAVNLLVARLSSRRRELAVRTALGASRTHVWMHLLTESAVLGSGGVVVGLLVARAGIAVLPVVASSYLTRVGEARLGVATVGFAVALAAASALLFAVVPLLKERGGSDPADALREGGRTMGVGPARQRAQRLLVAGQLAVVVPLLSGAALLLGSLMRLQAVDPGFDADRLVSMQVHMSSSVYPESADRRQFWQPALERLAALPRVEGVALSSERPPDDVYNINNFDLEDRPTPPGQSQPVAPWVLVDPSYFRVMGIPLLEGRTFVPSDLDDDAPPVLVVDRAWVDRNYPGESPVGRRLYSGGQTTGPRTTIVGVVGTVPYVGIGDTRMGAMYQPVPDAFGNPWLMVRTSTDPAMAAADLSAELRRLAPSSPVTGVATGRELLAGALTGPRRLTLLLGVFATVALLLALVGVYGITSYDVELRRRDIAVRLAMGGPPRTVLGNSLWRGMRVSLVGLAVGLGAAFVLTGALSSLLYGVTPRDPRAMAAAALLLLAVSALACLVPARRALRVDPAATLRED